jgi:magnesium chelatase family protein
MPSEVTRVFNTGTQRLEEVMPGLGLSARAYDKVRSAARTNEDIDSSEEIKAEHVAEANFTRGLIRESFWSKVAV